MRIALVSKANAPGGGASRIAEDLTQWFNAAGHEATHFCGEIIGLAKPFQSLLFPRSTKSRIVRAVHRRTRNYGLNEVVPLDHWLIFKERFKQYDVVHFHDHFLTYSMTGVGLLSRKQRVAFTAHDCLHFTGGCLYPMGCEKYLSRCHACPQRGNIGKHDCTGFNQRVNQWAARENAIRYIYPSKWLMDEAGKSLSFRVPPVVLPNGFDPGPYKIVSRTEARRALGLDADRKIICVSAHNLSDRRKGAEYALKAASAVADLNPLVVLVGNPINDVERLLPGMHFLFTGYITSRERLALYYAAADVLLFPTLQDNLPISVQESMATATPLVGFATGGVPEMVTHGETGWLVPTGDQAALNAALRDALLAPDLAERGQRAQHRLQTEYTVARCIEQHLEVYQRPVAQTT
mgnify:CR=1 FL=1